MPSRLSFRPAIGTVVALGLAAAPVATFAAGFTPEGQQHWLAVAHALIAASNAGTDEMGAACRGVSINGGSEIRNESTQVPRWAVMAHYQTCVGFNSLSLRERGKGFMQSTDPCKNIKAAVEELGKARAGVDPDEIVAVAGQLKATLMSLAGDYKDAKTCKARVVGLFG